MAKKPVTKKKTMPKGKTSTRKRAPTVGAMKGGVVVGGSIKAGRDVIMGDQYNDFRQQVAQISSPAEFVARAQELQTKIAEIKEEPGLLPAQVRRIEAVEADVQDVIEEAKKEKPVVERINSTLASAKETMDNIAKSIAAAVGLGTVLGGLGQIALKLFGG